MPRDKTAAYERIIRCMKEEFLAFGYEKASLNRSRGSYAVCERSAVSRVEADIRIVTGSA